MKTVGLDEEIEENNKKFLLPVVAIDSAPCKWIGRFVFLSSRPRRKWSSRLRRRKWSSRLRRAVC